MQIPRASSDTTPSGPSAAAAAVTRLGRGGCVGRKAPLPPSPDHPAAAPEPPAAPRGAVGPSPGLTLDGPAALLAVVEGEEVVGVAVAAPVGELLAALRVPVVVPARHQGAAGAVVGGQQAGSLLLCGRHEHPGLRPLRRRPRPLGSRPRGPLLSPTCEAARRQGGAGQRQQQRGQREAAAGGHVATAGGGEGRTDRQRERQADGGTDRQTDRDRQTEGGGVPRAVGAARPDGSALYAPRRLPRAASSLLARVVGGEGLIQRGSGAPITRPSPGAAGCAPAPAPAPRDAPRPPSGKARVGSKGAAGGGPVPGLLQPPSGGGGELAGVHGCVPISPPPALPRTLRDDAGRGFPVNHGIRDGARSQSPAVEAPGGGRQDPGGATGHSTHGCHSFNAALTRGPPKNEVLSWKTHGAERVKPLGRSERAGFQEISQLGLSEDF